MWLLSSSLIRIKDKSKLVAIYAIATLWSRNFLHRFAAEETSAETLWNWWRRKWKKKSANKKIIKLLEMKNKIKPSFHANVFPELSCVLLPAKDGERINKWKYNVNSPIGTVMTYVHQMLLLSSSRHKRSLLTYLQSKRPKRLPQPHILIQQLGPLRWYGGDYTRN